MDRHLVRSSEGGYGMTLDQIAHREGVTRQMVQHIITSAIGKMRRHRDLYEQFRQLIRYRAMLADEHRLVQPDHDEEEIEEC